MAPTESESILKGLWRDGRSSPIVHRARNRQLRCVSAVERGPEVLVLKYGHPFAGTSWDTWSGRGYRRRKQGECFHNAFSYSMQHQGLIYVEGFALSDLRWPVHHAWCVTEDDRVVDPTWPDVSEQAAYLGVAFPAKLSAELVLAEGGNHLDALMLGDERLLRDFEATWRRA
jgi:hypothetical protein